MTHQKLNSLLAEYQHVSRQVIEEKLSLAKARKHQENVLQAQKLVQEVAEGVQQRAHGQISSVVTRCLEAVFGENSFKFRIKFEQKRGKTEARLLFVDQEGNEIDPKSAAGGGAIDIAALALRLACLMLSTPRRRKLLVLDEPCRFLHGAEYRQNATSLLTTLSRELGVQIIMSTGLDWLKIGKIVDLENE